MALHVWLQKLGDTQVARGRIQDALESYNKALALDNESLELNKKLGSIYQLLGEVQLATQHQLKAAMLGSSSLTQEHGNSNVSIEKAEVDKSGVYNYRIKSPRLKLLYFEVPKNASSTIKTILFSIEDKSQYDSSYVKFMSFDKWQKRFPNMIVDWNEIPELPYLKFSFLRNPYERIVSGYLNTAWNFHHKGVSFDNFVETLPHRVKTPASDLFNNHYKPFTYFIPKIGDRLLIDFIGTVENFESDFKSILYACNISTDWIMPLHNKSQRSDYKSYYTARNRKILEDIFAEDIELGKYSF